jgi:hypothetical protein
VNAFDERRRCHGYNIAKWSADLSEESDIRVFVDVFFKFILQVQKQDGS